MRYVRVAALGLLVASAIVLPSSEASARCWHNGWGWRCGPGLLALPFVAAGAVIAGAPIQAKNVQTDVLYEGATSTTGNYTIAQLPVGTYDVSVTVPGFKKYTRVGLEIEVAQTLRADITLEVGSSSESVTVTEAAPLLKTESGELSHTVYLNQITERLCLPSRAGFEILTKF